MQVSFQFCGTFYRHPREDVKQKIQKTGIPQLGKSSDGKSVETVRERAKSLEGRRRTVGNLLSDPWSFSENLFSRAHGNAHPPTRRFNSPKNERQSTARMANSSGSTAGQRIIGRQMDSRAFS